MLSLQEGKEFDALVVDVAAAGSPFDVFDSDTLKVHAYVLEGGGGGGGGGEVLVDALGLCVCNCVTCVNIDT